MQTLMVVLKANLSEEVNRSQKVSPENKCYFDPQIQRNPGVSPRRASAFLTLLGFGRLQIMLGK